MEVAEKFSSHGVWDQHVLNWIKGTEEMLKNYGDSSYDFKGAVGDYAEEMVKILESFGNVNFCHADFVKNQEHGLVTQEDVLEFVSVNLFLMTSL